MKISLMWFIEFLNRHEKTKASSWNCKTTTQVPSGGNSRRQGTSTLAWHIQVLSKGYFFYDSFSYNIKWLRWIIFPALCNISDSCVTHRWGFPFRLPAVIFHLSLCFIFYFLLYLQHQILSLMIVRSKESLRQSHLKKSIMKSMSLRLSNIQ